MAGRHRKTGRKQSGSIAQVGAVRQRSLFSSAELRALTVRRRSRSALGVAIGAAGYGGKGSSLDHPVPAVLDGREAAGEDEGADPLAGDA
jgi:hypothetical protein